MLTFIPRQRLAGRCAFTYLLKLHTGCMRSKRTVHGRFSEKLNCFKKKTSHGLLRLYWWFLKSVSRSRQLFNRPFSTRRVPDSGLTLTPGIGASQSPRSPNWKHRIRLQDQTNKSPESTYPESSLDPKTLPERQLD